MRVGEREREVGAARRGALGVKAGAGMTGVRHLQRLDRLLHVVEVAPSALAALAQADDAVAPHRAQPATERPPAERVDAAVVPAKGACAELGVR